MSHCVFVNIEGTPEDAQPELGFCCTVHSRYLEVEGLSGIHRDIRTSTYQICEIEENNKSNNHI